MVDNGAIIKVEDLEKDYDAILLAIGTAQAESAAGIGQAVVDVYIETMKDTAELLADRPPAESVQEAFRARKEESVQALVALGHAVTLLEADGVLSSRLPS